MRLSWRLWLSKIKKGAGMPQNTICRTVHQYSKEPISQEDMRKLQEIAKDYCKVKNYVYTCYGGIASLSKLYPGYTIQNEMTKNGLRETIGMPSVYFYLAIFDALGDIKSQWARTKSKVLGLISRNSELSSEEKHYLRFLIKVSSCFDAVLNQRPMNLPKEIKKKYEELAINVDTKKLHHYLCRQVRKYHIKQHTNQALGFSLSERAYRYGDHGIYISVKEKRKRIFVLLTDNNQYKCQIYLKLYPEEGQIKLNIPVNIAVKRHEDYENQVGVSMGLYTMLTTDRGNQYGKILGKYQMEYADWVRWQTRIYNRNRDSNPGRKKYSAKKRCYKEQMYSYINHELNSFLQTEKPRVIYIVKLPNPKAGGINRRINNSVAMWQRGYIRSRLEQKCRENSVELVEVLGKDISNECSICGTVGSKQEGIFSCSACGYCIEEKTNTARNVLKRGKEGKIRKW